MQNFVGPKIFGTQNYYGSKKYFGSKVVWTQNLISFDSNFFGPKFFLDLIKIFVDPNFFGPQILLGRKFFWTQFLWTGNQKLVDPTFLAQIDLVSDFWIQISLNLFLSLIFGSKMFLDLYFWTTNLDSTVLTKNLV